jgi:hypothetical protein
MPVAATWSFWRQSTPGAEVIADGHIHIYAPLHGRALAGASGDTDARIFCTRFDAQLVSVAGLYRTFDSGVPAELAGKAVQVRLAEKSGESLRKTGRRAAADRLALLRAAAMALHRPQQFSRIPILRVESCL